MSSTTHATSLTASLSLSSQSYFLYLYNLILALCIRPTPRRHVHSPRLNDLQAEENFVEAATSKSVSELLSNPQRDTNSYDNKDPVRFSTPAISALHARIGLPSSFPLSTLQRCLTDPTVEKDHTLHNEALSVIGSGLLEYYVSEYLCIRWPRLPMKTQMAALWAFTGESALARISREWGVTSVTLKIQMDKVKKVVKRNLRRDGIQEAAVMVDVPTSVREKIDHDLGVTMAWEVREQARQGWLEPRKRVGVSGFLDTLDEKEYRKRFDLFALQRFLQAVVGGVYVHSVHLPPPCPILSLVSFLLPIFLLTIGHHNNPKIHKSTLPITNPATPFNPPFPPIPGPRSNQTLRTFKNTATNISSNRRIRTTFTSPYFRGRGILWPGKIGRRTGNKYERSQDTREYKCVESLVFI